MPERHGGANEGPRTGGAVGRYERYATLFGDGRGRGLQRYFGNGTWTSIAVLFNPHMGLHRDIQNMPGHSNHALALVDYTGGRVWIENDDGDSTAWGAAGQVAGTCTTSP